MRLSELSLSELRKAKKEIYGEQGYESVRLAIEQNYKHVEDVYNKYVDGKMSGSEFASVLGGVVLGIEGEHPSSQVYAFELLVKSLAEAKDRMARDRIVAEIVFSVAAEVIPVKREYLLGILAHYGSQERHEARELERQHNQHDVLLQDEATIFENIHGGIAELRTYNDLPQEMIEVSDLITDDFPRGTEEGETARLIAAYYGHEPHPTTPPDPKSSRILDNIGGSGKRANGGPWYTYTLPEGYHTSREKINEAQLWKIPLFTQLVKYDEARDTKTGVIFDVDPQLSHAYIEKLRTLTDRGDWKSVFEYMEKYKQELWEKLDGFARAFFGRPEDLRVLVQTIRDHTVDGALSKSASEATKELEMKAV